MRCTNFSNLFFE